MEVLEAALELVSGADPPITIGGGEPTIHPQFRQIMCRILEERGRDQWETAPQIITNGKKTDELFFLLGLGDAVSLAVSRDEWHEPLPDAVVKMLDQRKVEKWGPKSWDHLLYQGRAQGLLREYYGAWYVKEGVAKNHQTDCVCNSLMVKPNGDIRWCGCTRAPKVGTVWSGLQLDYSEYDGCYRDHKEQED